MIKNTLLISILCMQFSFAQELARVKDKELVGFIKKNGEYQITPTFKQALDLQEGRIAVQEKTLWGFIDVQGNWVIPAKYEKVRSFNNGIAMVKKNRDWIYIDSLGKEIQPLGQGRQYEFNQGTAFFRDDTGLVGLINTKQEVLLKPIYQVIRPFHEGYARVKKDNLWGIIDHEGKEVIAPKHEEISNFKNQTSWVRNGKNWSLVSPSKEIAVPAATKIEDIENAEAIIAHQGKKVGFINSSGKWIIPPTFDNARDFAYGLAPVQINGLWGYIDIKGQIILKPSYKNALSFSKEGLAGVKNSKWGFIDRSGKVIIPFQYDLTAFSFSKQEKGFINGLARVKLNNNWGFINEKGKLLGLKWYRNVELFKQ